MRKMRVLHVINRADHGGAEVYAIKIIEGLASEKFDHFLGYSVGGPILERYRKLPVGLFCMSSDALTFRSPVGGLRAAYRLIRFIRRNRIDVIHAHVFESYVWCCLVSAASGVSLIRTVVSSRRDAPVWTRPVEWLCSAFTKKFICFTQASRSEMTDYGISRSKLEVIPNGIDLCATQVTEERIDRVRQKLGEISGPVIGNVGRLTWHKNQALLLGAVSQVIPRTGGICVIDGDGPLRNELAEQASALGISDRVRFPGWSDDVHALIALFDVFVLSSATEGVPNVVLEAMALDTPVVATDVGGVSDLVEDGVTGCLVAPGDPDAMAEAITDLLTDSEKAAELSGRARSQCLGKFNMKNVCARIAGLYGSL